MLIYSILISPTYLLIPMQVSMQIWSQDACFSSLPLSLLDLWVSKESPSVKAIWNIPSANKAGMLSVGPYTEDKYTPFFSGGAHLTRGEIYLPHINEKGPLSLPVRPLDYHLRRRAVVIFNLPPPIPRHPHPPTTTPHTHPHTELIAFDSFCIIIWILIKALYINLGPPTVIVNFQ